MKSAWRWVSRIWVIRYPPVPCGFNVNLHVTAGVDNGAFLLPTDQIGAVRDSFQEKLLYKHDVTSV
jgi:hypothetical protein